MTSKRRALVTCCIFPSSVGQPIPRQLGILRCSTFAGCWFCYRTAGAEKYKIIVTSTTCARPRAITSLSLQIPNYLWFGPTQVRETVDTDFGGPLPIRHFMWYFDTHLHHLKETKGFRSAFAFIDHQLDLMSKIAAMEPGSCMYLLGVSTKSLSD